MEDSDIELALLHSDCAALGDSSSTTSSRPGLKQLLQQLPKDKWFKPYILRRQLLSEIRIARRSQACKTCRGESPSTRSLLLRACDSSRCPMVSVLSRYLSSLPQGECLCDSQTDLMSQSIIDEMCYLMPRIRDERGKSELRGAIDAAVYKAYGPRLSVRVFGSCASDMETFSSDLDMVLLDEEAPATERYTFMPKDSARRILNRLKAHIYKLRMQDLSMIYISQAKVPLIKLQLGDQEGDISCSGPSSIFTHRLLMAYSCSDARLKPLILVVKYFCKKRCLGDASSMSLNSLSYTLILIRYLQTLPEPVLPVLFQQQSQRMNRNGDHEQLLDWLEESREFVSLNKMSLSELLTGFLRYFLSFNYSRQSVSIRRLDPTSRFQHDTPLYIEDPLDAANNIARSLNKVNWGRIRREFEQALALLEGGRATSVYDLLSAPKRQVPPATTATQPSKKRRKRNN